MNGAHFASIIPMSEDVDIFCWVRNFHLVNHHLDGYNEELKLAYEFQGPQHFSENPMFHKRGKIDLDSQQTRDQKKRDVCKREDIDLIEVPYTCDLFLYKKQITREKLFIV